MFIKLDKSYAMIYFPFYSSAIFHTEIMIMPQSISFLMAVILADD